MDQLDLVVFGYVCAALRAAIVVTGLHLTVPASGAAWLLWRANLPFRRAERAAQACSDFFLRQHDALLAPEADVERAKYAGAVGALCWASTVAAYSAALGLAARVIRG